MKTALLLRAIEAMAQHDTITSTILQEDFFEEYGEFVSMSTVQGVLVRAVKLGLLTKIPSRPKEACLRYQRNLVQ